MKKLMIPTRNTETKEVFGDLVMDLENRKFTIFDIRNAMSRLNTLDDFGFIVPRRFLVNITTAYTMEELPYEDMSLEDPATQAYKKWDAVMIKRDRKLVLQ